MFCRFCGFSFQTLFISAEVENFVASRDYDGGDHASGKTVILESSEGLIEEKCVCNSLIDDLGTNEGIDRATRSVAEGQGTENITKDEENRDDAALYELIDTELVLHDVGDVKASGYDVHVDLCINRNIEEVEAKTVF